MVEDLAPRQVDVARNYPEGLLELAHLLKRIDHCHAVGLEVQGRCLENVQKF